MSQQLEEMKFEAPKWGITRLRAKLTGRKAVDMVVGLLKIDDGASLAASCWKAKLVLMFAGHRLPAAARKHENLISPPNSNRPDLPHHPALFF